MDFRKEAENAKRCRDLLQGGRSTFHLVLPQRSLLQSILFRLAAKAASWFRLSNPHIGDNNGSKLPNRIESDSGNALLVTNEQKRYRSPVLHTGSTATSTFRIQDGGSNSHPQDDSSHCLTDYQVELYVPRVYNHLTTARVLVMERCKGVAVDDLRGILSQGNLELYEGIAPWLFGALGLPHGKSCRALVTFLFTPPQESTP